MHKDDKELEPISHENEYRKEIDQLNEECFPGWQHRRKPFWWLENDEKRPEDDSLYDESLDNNKDHVGQPMKRVSEWTCRVCYFGAFS
ncbi:hypothetical protein COOONC_12253 [Cooperia oncophora]